MVAGHQWTDPGFLRGEQYRNDANLRARQSIYAFQRPRVDLPRAVVDLARLRSEDVVLDVGCGNGAYFSRALPTRAPWGWCSAWMRR